MVKEVEMAFLVPNQPAELSKAIQELADNKCRRESNLVRPLSNVKKNFFHYKVIFVISRCTRNTKMNTETIKNKLKPIVYPIINFIPRQRTQEQEFHDYL